MKSNESTKIRRPRSGAPKYKMLAERFRTQIHSGQLAIGDRLPSFAEMRSRFGVTSTTIEHAYRLLEQENLIERRSGSGVYVASPQTATAVNIGLLLRSAFRKPTHDFSYSQFVLEGIHEASRELGTNITLMNDNDSISRHQLDGILLWCDKWEVYTMGIPEELPQVILFQHSNDLTAVTADDFNGSRLATEHLIAQGHRRIACLSEENLDIPIQRRAGYLAALQNAGIEPQPQWMRLTEKTPPGKNHYYQDWGRRQMQAWLNEGWRDLNCTAIVAQNDLSAIGIIQVLQEAGYDIPGDISVIGFDGTPICDLTQPRLTSIQIPLVDIGKEAVKVLFHQIKNGPQTPRDISLPVTLRPGASVASVHNQDTNLDAKGETS